jgi:hypothetical protein
VVRVREEDEGEEELTRACKGTRLVVRKAFEVCRPGTTGRAILEYVNRKEAAGDQSMKAFDGSLANMIRRGLANMIRRGLANMIRRGLANMIRRGLLTSTAPISVLG